MDDLAKCDQRSKFILKNVKTAFNQMKQLIEIENELNDSEHENDEESSSLVEHDECFNREEMLLKQGQNNEIETKESQHKEDPDYFANDETKLFDEISPVKLTSVQSKPNSVHVRSSTPLLKKHKQGSVLRQTGESTKSNDSEGLWSIDSKPIAMGTTTTSSNLDFHLVETVLPVTKKSFNVYEQITLKDIENDDNLSDGSQSHTVFTITKLMSSLNEEKRKNKELEEKLSLTENELASSRIQLELNAAKEKQEETGKLADLVEEIYTAQKEREHAVIERLKLANKERDEAILRAHAFAKDARHNLAKENHEFYNSKTLQELIDAACSADTGRAADRFGKDIVSHICNLKIEKERITAEEMATVIKERDKALHKCRSACIELQNLKDKTCRDGELLRNQRTNEWDESERKKIDAKLSKTDQELETLRTYYSLHKSYLENKETRRELLGTGDADRLAHALRIAHEHNNIQTANTRRQEVNIGRLQERNEKLERLVTVLRKKVSMLAQKSIQQVTESSDHVLSRSLK